MTVGGEVRLLETPFHSDDRGVFAKPYMRNEDTGVLFETRELFWSSSSRGTVRGMHFQEPPRPAGKLVWVSAGRVVDFVVDIRRDGDYGKVHRFELDGSTGRTLWVPQGFAHGFQALEDRSIVNYAVDDVYVPEVDLGIRWDSVGIEWPLPVTEVSARDRAHPSLADYRSPFGA